MDLACGPCVVVCKLDDGRWYTQVCKTLQNNTKGDHNLWNQINWVSMQFFKR